LRALILYYSCSGNTRRLGQQAHEALLSRHWNADIFHLRDFSKEHYPHHPDLIVLGVPVQYWDIPNAAKRLIEDLPPFKGTSAFVFSTFGKCVINRVPFLLAKELKAKGCTIVGGGQIVAPHAAKVDGRQRLGDLEIAFGKGQPDDAALSKFIAVIQGIAEKIERNTASPIELAVLKKLHTRGVLASLMDYCTSNRQRMGFMPHIDHDATKCKNCHQCIAFCDAGAISCAFEKEIVIDKSRCNKCYRCIDECPSGALGTDWKQAVFWVRAIRLLAKDAETKLINS
jgi:ferredoxin/flavodoxin